MKNGSNKKELILKSVLKLVNREGFYHLNMKSIAQEANVAAGTIYLYFKSKEDLINELYRMIVSNFNDAVLRTYNDKNTTKENFYNMLKTAVEFYLNEPDMFSFVEQYTYAPFLFKETREENFLLLAPVYQIMRKGKKEGVMKNISEELLTSIVYGAMSTMLKFHLAEKTDLKKRGATKRLYDACWEAVTVC